MEINERVMHANFGDPRSHDRELRHTKHGKFWHENLLNLPITQKPLGAHR